MILLTVEAYSATSKELKKEPPPKQNKTKQKQKQKQKKERKNVQEN